MPRPSRPPRSGSPPSRSSHGKGPRQPAKGPQGKPPSRSGRRPERGSEIVYEPRSAQGRPQGRPQRRPEGGSPREKDREREKVQRIAGEAAVAAVFATAPQRVQRLFFEDRLKGATGQWCLQLAQMRKSYRVVGTEELSRVAGTPMHGGIVALVDPRPVQAFDARAAAAWAKEGKPVLLLDGVSNPHNFGAIVRTAAFFGIRHLIVSDHSGQALPSDASYRVAEGGFEYLEIVRATNFARAVRDLRASFRVLGASAEGGKAFEALKADKRPDALILGNEEHGLSPATAAACDALVTIPGSGAVQSLNVAASAAILLHTLAAKSNRAA